jgi:hypothetical protein
MHVCTSAKGIHVAQPPKLHKRRIDRANELSERRCSVGAGNLEDPWGDDV